MKIGYLKVINMNSDEEVHKVKVTNPTTNKLEKIIRGIMINSISMIVILMTYIGNSHER